MYDISDGQLIQEYLRKRDQRVFEDLYVRYAHKVYRKCFFYGGDRGRAEDLAQGAWIRVYLKLELFDGRSSFATWLYRVVVNYCINELKKEKMFVSLDVLQEKGFDVVQASEEDNIINAGDVTKTLQCLSKELRVLLLLKYVEGYTYEEIASQTGQGVSAVKMKIHRAKRQIITKR